MILLLSPAKIFRNYTCESLYELSTPIFQSEANQLMLQLRGKSVDEMMAILKTNSRLASKALKDAYDFFDASEKGVPAIMAFFGVAYKNLRAADFGDDDLEFAQKHLRIASPLYGILRALDEIKPYRLDFMNKIEDSKISDFWGDRIVEALRVELQGDDKLLVNIASKESCDAVNIAKLSKSLHVVNIRFIVIGEHGLQSAPSVKAKQLRGAFARYAIKNRLCCIDELRLFSHEGVRYLDDMSNSENIVYLCTPN